MKIGIFIEHKDLFSNGIVQQSLFIYELFKQANIDTHFISVDKDYKIFELTNINIVCCSTVNDCRSFTHIIFLSSMIRNREHLNELKKLGIKLISYNCGNWLTIFQEDILFNIHKRVACDSFATPDIDQLWIIPNYKNHLEFYKTLIPIETHVVPYVWNKTIIQEWNSLKYDPKQSCHENIVLIMEPNINISKNCMTPLLICEKLYKSFKNFSVLVMCAPSNESFTQFLNCLQLYHDNKIELYPRIQTPEVIQQLKKKNKNIIVLSNQNNNALNFLHLEILYLEYPLIHNTIDYQDAGYYYHDIFDGSKKLHLAIKDHPSNLRQYRSQSEKVFKKYSPSNKNNLEIYKSLLIK